MRGTLENLHLGTPVIRDSHQSGDCQVTARFLYKQSAGNFYIAGKSQNLALLFKWSAGYLVNNLLLFVSEYR
jgi:hypothetical protein